MAGNATIEQIKKVARMKMDSMMANSLTAAVLEVIGTCVSLGITIDGKDPKEAQMLIKKGEIKI